MITLCSAIATARAADGMDIHTFLGTYDGETERIRSVNPVPPGSPAYAGVTRLLEVVLRDDTIRRRLVAEAPAYAAGRPLVVWLLSWTMHRGSKGVRYLEFDEQEHYVMGILVVAKRVDEDTCGRAMRSGAQAFDPSVLGTLSADEWSALETPIERGLAAYAIDPQRVVSVDPMGVIGGMAALRKMHDMEIGRAFATLSDPGDASNREMCRAGQKFFGAAMQLDLTSKRAMFQQYVNKL